jgi:hypothetical protein
VKANLEKMRWKWLLLLSLISISLVVVSGNDDEKEGDNYDSDNGDTVYDDETPEEDDKEEEPIAETSEAEDPISSTEATIEQEQDLTNEDAVDVESVPIAKQKGKYMSYDDYFVASAVDGGSDSNYNWNGEYPTSKST